VISLTQRPLPDDKQNSQETDNHVPGGIKTQNSSSERPQIHALDRATTGMCIREYYKQKIPSEIQYKILKEENTKLEYNTWLFN
jgi:hypothetical protein